MKHIIIFLISSNILFNSCTKWEQPNSFPNQPTTPRASTTPDSLKGKEFVFDSLEWIDNDFGNPIFYLEDLSLFMPGRHLSVAIKHDTLSVWEQVNSYDGGLGSWGYSYNVSIGILVVWLHPAQPALIGKRFSLKVKFL